jgi:hypothetical protein
MLQIENNISRTPIEIKFQRAPAFMLNPRTQGEINTHIPTNRSTHSSQNLLSLSAQIENTNTIAPKRKASHEYDILAYPKSQGLMNNQIPETRVTQSCHLNERFFMIVPLSLMIIRPQTYQKAYNN